MYREERKKLWLYGGVYALGFFLILLSSRSAFSLDCQKITSLQSDAFFQWLMWETIANVDENVVPTGPHKIPVIPVSKHEALPRFCDKGCDPEILSQFTRGSGYLWLRHPFNRDPAVPYFHATPTEYWDGYATSSRTMVIFTAGGRALGVKMPSSRTRPQRESQGMLNKANMRSEVRAALTVSSYLDAREAKLGIPKGLVYLRESFALVDVLTKNGFLVRDLSPMQDGHYYMPAFSIPYVQPDLAEKYAELTGRRKALFLVHYGMQVKSVHPQNSMMQLNKDHEGKLHSTDVLFWRDTSDAMFVEKVANALGEHAAVSKDLAQGWKTYSELKPNGMLSFRFFERLFPHSRMHSLLETHDRAYVQELNRLLGADIRLPEVFEGPSSSEKESNYIARANEFVLSAEGLRTITHYAETHAIP